MPRRLLTALLALVAGLGLVIASPQAGSATPGASTICTPRGSCISVTRRAGINRFTVAVTCRRGDSFAVGIRGYFTSGDFSTSPPRRVTCRTAASQTLTRAYVGGGRMVGWRVFLGAVPRLGTYAGTQVPSGGHEILPGIGFHWD